MGTVLMLGACAIVDGQAPTVTKVQYYTIVFTFHNITVNLSIQEHVSLSVVMEVCV